MEPLEKMEKKKNELSCHDYLSQTPTKSGNHFHLSVNKYSEKLRDDYTNANLTSNNVLSIFSYSLRYMDKKSLNKWLKRNIKAPFYDTLVLKNKPIAYIRFRNYAELKVFEKLIENKQFYENDNMSIIKIHKPKDMPRKRKLNGVGTSSLSEKLERKRLRKERKERREKKGKGGLIEKENESTGETRIEPTELLDLQSIIKLNRETKNKTVKNYVTPFYSYPYMDQIKIKHSFLKKCKGQILKNLQKNWEKQKMLFGNIEHNSNGIFEDTPLNSSNGISSRNAFGNENTSARKTGEKTNKRNETSTDSCLKNCVLKKVTSAEVTKDYSLEKKIKEYDIEVDEPVIPDESGRYAYRNKCEFTIAYDENKNVEIGFVVRKLKQNISSVLNSENTLQDDGVCNFSENNISDNNANPVSGKNLGNIREPTMNEAVMSKNYGDSVMNESRSAKLRNKKTKDAYFLNPVVEGVDNCLHIHDCMKDVVKAMKKIIKESPYPVFDRVYKTGVWKLLIVRATSKKDLLITVQTNRLDQKKKKEIKKLLINRLTKQANESHMYFSGYKVVSLYLQEHENANDSTNESPNEHLWGEETLEEVVLNNRFLIAPASFFQVNHASCELLYSKVIKYVKVEKEKTNYIFDLCCGTGTIGISVLKALEGGEEDINLIGIELCEESITCANKNAALNDVKNYKFIEGRIEDEFPKEIKKIKDKNANIVVIVDPPRSGLVNSLINTLTSNTCVNQILYVSCNPISLVQNVSSILFQNEKMRMKNMAFVDMFPHTFHLECIVNMLKQ